MLNHILLIYNKVKTIINNIFYISSNHLYKKNENDTSDGTDLSLTNSIQIYGPYGMQTHISLDKNKQFIYYRNEEAGVWKIYKKDINSVSDGVYFIDGKYPMASKDGLYLIYVKDEHYFYKKDINDTSIGTAISPYIDLIKFPSLSDDGNFILYGVGYTLTNDPGIIYKKDVNDVLDVGTPIMYSGATTALWRQNQTNLFENVTTFCISPDFEDIVYVNINDGNKLYKKKANIQDSGFPINSVSSNFPTYSKDGNYIVYTNQSDGYKLYKKNIGDSLNGTAITTDLGINAIYSNDGNYIIYVGREKSYFDGNIHRTLYKKNANDTANGTAITNPPNYIPYQYHYGSLNNLSRNDIMLSNRSIVQKGFTLKNGVISGPITSVSFYTPCASPDGTIIVYSNGNDGGKLYKKNANDTSDGTAITSVNSKFPFYSPDGTYIVYSNLADGGKIYRKNANDTANGTAINTLGSSFMKYSPDGNYIIYTNNSNGYLYRKNAGDSLDGTILVNRQCFGCCYSLNGTSIIYGYTGGLYKKNSGDTSYGSLITPATLCAYPVMDSIGDTVIYIKQDSSVFRLYRKSINTTDYGTRIDKENILLNCMQPCIAPDGDVIYTRKMQNGAYDVSGTLYKKSLNTFDNGTRITPVARCDFPSISPDGNYILFTNQDYSFNNRYAAGTLYKKDINSTSGLGTAVNGVGGGIMYYTEDMLYIIGIATINNILKFNASNFSNYSLLLDPSGLGGYSKFSNDGTYIYYSSGGNIYKKTSDGFDTGVQEISGGGAYRFCFNSGNDKIIYNNTNDDYHLYQKSINGISGVGTEINSIESYSPET